MSKKIKLEIKEEQEAFEEQLRSERIETSDMATKPEVRYEIQQMVKIEIPNDLTGLGDSVLYCIGGTFVYSNRVTGRDDYQPQPSISYLSHSLTTPHWSTIDWPHPRIKPATVIHDHKLYIFGGNTAYYTLPTGPHIMDPVCYYERNYLDTIEVFDLRAKRWLPAHRLPVGMGETSACSLGDYIYFCGGHYKTATADELYSVKLLRYCPISCQLEEKQSPSNINGAYGSHENVLVPGSDTCLLALDGYLYAVSGGNYWNGYLSIGRYDPSTDQWSSIVRTANSERYLLSPFSATVHRKKIYVLNEYFGLEVFCPRAVNWTRLADTPDHDEGDCTERVRKVYGELASINDRLVLMENRCCKPYFRVFEFDFEAGVWIRRADGNTPRDTFAVQVYNPSR